MVKERPILFSGPMVNAILEGRKTQTRRVIKPVQPRTDGLWPAGRNPLEDCPYGAPSDRLWVRETWYCDHCFERDYAKTGAVYVGRTLSRKECEDEWRSHLFFRADGEPDFGGERADWKPSIHMPRWASRLALEVTEVRVQRLQKISEADARAEGVGEPAFVHEGNHNVWAKHGHERYRLLFQGLWDSINGERLGCSWSDDPWVWALTFKVAT